MPEQFPISEAAKVVITNKVCRQSPEERVDFTRVTLIDMSHGPGTVE